MEREIRYCTTDDGVRIAYAISGDGPVTLVHTPNVYHSVLQAEQLASRQRWMEQLFPHFRVLRYDPRGTGMSQLEVEDVSPEAWLADLAAVIDKGSNGPVAIFGYLSGICVTLLYALRYPERVAHLLLWPPPIVETGTPQASALGQIAVANWELFTENYSHMALGWNEGAEAHEFARIMRDTLTREMYFRYWAASRPLFRGEPAYDQLIRDCSAIKVPTLIMQRTPSANDPFIGQLAASVPNASVKIFDGESTAPTIGNIAEVVETMASFAGASARPAARTRPGPQFMTILFTDVVDHAAIFERLGDAAGRALLREHDKIVRSMLRRHDGTEVKTAGDGFMASFESVTSATQCAIELQRALEKRNRGAAEPIMVRCGLNAGEPIEESGDYFGSSVNLAARVAALAGAGEIFIPEPVRHLLAGKDFVFADRGGADLKGFAEPVRLFEVVWRS